MIRKLMAAAVVAAALCASSIVDDARKKIKEGKYEEAIAGLEPARKSAPKDAAITRALVDAHLAYGDFFMFNQQMRPMQKYPSALKQYRQVLVYDKTNAKAKENIGTIEGIYKSMGRPVPQ